MNDELQVMAEELVKLDKESDQERIYSIIFNMYEIELNYMVPNKYTGNVFFPLLTKYNNYIEEESFVDVLFDALVKATEKYDPTKSKFYYYFKNTLNYHVADWVRKEMKEKGRMAPPPGDEYGAHEDYLETTADAAMIRKRRQNTITTVDDVPDTTASDAFEAVAAWLDFAGILEEYMQMLQEKAKSVAGDKKYQYLQGFYTFDTTKAVKTDPEIAEVACTYNDILFRLLLMGLLCYLMEGEFRKMLDVVHNPLRVGIELNKRNETLERYFGKSHPTISKFSKKYEDLRSSIYGTIGDRKYHSF